MKRSNSTQHSCILPVKAWKIVLAVLALATFKVGPITIQAASAIPSNGNPICNSPNKKLYVLAGPRRAATSSVADFFYQWARGPQPNRKSGKKYHPLAKFRWPMVYGPASNKTDTEMPYKRFNSLVTDYGNEPLRKEILEAIKRDWELADVDSIIFGGDKFDQVGADAKEGYDALRAVRDVVEFIGAEPGCVTVIVNYRDIRFEHWVSMYGDGMLADTKEDPMPYNEHMCVEESTTVRLQELGTSMNPMLVAESYLREGWQVKMIDMGGVESKGTDIAHTIACDIMGGHCDDDGWVKGHHEEVFSNKFLQYDFDHLSREEIDLSEKLFRYRDCAFQEDLQTHPWFTVIKEEGIWTDCQHDKDHEWIYQSFRDPTTGTKLFYDALLSQVDCKPFGGPKSAINESNSEKLETAKIDEFLDGTYQKNFMNVIMEDVGGVSVPLVLVLILVAGGAGFYLHKVRENPNYKLPGIEMAGGFTDGFSDNGMGNKNNDSFSDEHDDESSSDDDDNGDFV